MSTSVAKLQKLAGIRPYLPALDEGKTIARAASKDEVAELQKYVKQVAGKNFSVTQPTKGSLKGKTAVRAKGKFVNGRVAAAKIGKWLLKNGWIMLPGGTKAIQSILDSLKVRITQDPDGYEDFTLLMKKPTEVLKKEGVAIDLDDMRDSR